MERAMQKSLKVSIIVPCYNYGHLIAETIDSIKTQTYENIEVLIIDDGSTDDSKSIILKNIEHDSRFKYIYQENAGISAARNRGLQNCTGDFIQFLDADDLICSDKLSYQIDCLCKNEQLDIITTEVNYFYINELGEKIFLINQQEINGLLTFSGNTKNSLLSLIQQNRIAINSPLIRRSIIDKVGQFDSTLKWVEDWDFWIRIFLKECNIIYSNKNNTQAQVRIHNTNTSKNNVGMIQSSILLRRKLRRLIWKYPRCYIVNEYMLFLLKGISQSFSFSKYVYKLLRCIKDQFK